MRASWRLFFPALLLALGAPRCAAEKREVRTCEELMHAMNDTAVDHVLMLRGPEWNCSEASIPQGSIVVDNRTVVLEGEGPGRLYVDFNRGSQRQVTVLNGGFYHQKNLWADDCIGPDFPFLCFAHLLEGSSSMNDGDQLSDASCVNVKHSVGIKSILTGVRLMTMLRGGAGVQYLDDRTVLVSDTGWMEFYSPKGAKWRLKNTTFTCTGNITHALPDEFELIQIERMSFRQRVLAAIAGVVLFAVAARLFYVARRRAKDLAMPEYQVASNKGFELEEPLGSGHFGRVFKGRNKTTGQPVAVKVIDLLPSQRRQLAAAWRECQLLSQLQHDCIVRVLSFYAAQVERRKRVLELKPGNQYVELGFDVAGVNPISDGGVSWMQKSASSLGFQPALSSDFGSGGGGAGSAGSGEEGVMSIQVQLVMQFCDMGTLEGAIKGGAFRDPLTNQPRMRHILLTALEMAQGLAYLHHRDRRLVHRDLSTANVLLTTHGDERGFRALLSDFGLTTCLVDQQTHKTSEVKGTISYMSPEVFLHDDISPALDIYSLGIILHMMLAGRDPFAGQSPAMIILSKVRAGEIEKESHLPPLKGCPPTYQRLVWDVTHPDRRKRPSAAQLVQRLEAMLAGTAP